MQLSDIAKDKLSIVDKRIQSFANGYRQNIALFANDNEELTYLLETYFSNNPAISMPVIHVSTRHAGAKRFFKNIAISILTSQVNTPLSIDALISQAGDILPNTTTLIKGALAAEEITFTMVLDVVNGFIEESKKPLIFVINEFQGLKRIFGSCLEDFSKFIILQRGCMVVVSSSQQADAEKILSGELNLLFGNFERIYCNENSFISRYNQVYRALERSPEPSLVASFIVNIIDDNTLYYKHILENAVAHSSLFAADDIIMATIENTLYSPQTYLHQKFLSAINQIENSHKQYGAAVQILSAISKGYIRKQEITSLKLAESKTIDARLNKFCEDGMIVNHGNIYQINDRLFSFWLANIFSFHTSYTNSLQRKILWQQHMRAEIALFKTQISKSKLERLRYLAALFRDDSFTLGNESYKLPALTRTTLTSYPEENMHLMIGEGREIMVMGIKERDAKDSDVFSFAEKGSNIKGKGVKKLFVSLGAMPDTAKLAAKNHRFQALGINELNQVMKLYNQPILSI